MKNICVYCGSNKGLDEKYTASAISLGEFLAKENIGLVYGGSNVGLMGILADTVLAGGGKVTGIIPDAIKNKEVAHHGLTELIVVGSMHERKAKMVAKSDGFIAMPGGFGTLDEFCEIVTWLQLGLHKKPCGILNVKGYYNGFMNFINHGVSEGFIKPVHRDMIHVNDSPVELINSMKMHNFVNVSKWSGVE